MATKSKKKVPHRDECEVSTWFERGSGSITVSLKDGGRQIVGWVDSDIDDMVEGGFFDTSGFVMGTCLRPGRLESSVLDYCVEVGLLRG